jgi:hypothetical protein
MEPCSAQQAHAQEKQTFYPDRHSIYRFGKLPATRSAI